MISFPIKHLDKPALAIALPPVNKQQQKETRTRNDHQKVSSAITLPVMNTPKYQKVQISYQHQGQQVNQLPQLESVKNDKIYKNEEPCNSNSKISQISSNELIKNQNNDYDFDYGKPNDNSIQMLVQANRFFIDKKFGNKNIKIKLLIKLINDD